MWKRKVSVNMHSSIVPFKTRCFFCSLTALRRDSYVGRGPCVIPLIRPQLNLSSASDALTLFLRWFQVLHMSGSRTQCRGARPPQSPNQSLPVSGFCCRPHAHTPKNMEKTHARNSVKSGILNGCSEVSMMQTVRRNNSPVCSCTCESCWCVS